MEQRLDRFYTWAEQVQVELRKLHAVHAENEELRQEIRNLKQRVGFLEAILQNEFNFAPSSADQGLVALVGSHPCALASVQTPKRI